MWHVGNEFGQACFCDLCADRFRTWLRARYGDLDALNRAWGTAFWSQRYGDWQEIVPPRAAPYVHNPTQLLDFRRFTSDQLRDVYRLQAEIIRASSTHPSRRTRWASSRWSTSSPGPTTSTSSPTTTTPTRPTRRPPRAPRSPTT